MIISTGATAPADADTRIFLTAKGQEPVVSLESARILVDGAKAARFEGEAGGWHEAFVAEGDAILRAALLGTGGGSVRDIEKAGGTISARLLTGGARHVAIMADGLSADDAALLVLGLRLRAWRMDSYRTKQPDNAKPTLETVTIVTSADVASTLARTDAVVEGVSFTRTLVAEPGNVLYPESFVDRCRPLADLGIEVSVLHRDDMERLGMGALLGVAQGSVREPRILALRWDGSGGTQPSPVALVGKGVTFDSGGISLKPAAGMEDMKWDMGGAGAVAGVMKTLALRKANAHVVGICGLVENMPDGNAQRPGDVVTSMSGQTIEVVNTDAEGRLVLADVIWWAQQTFSPTTLVDLATLTGAMIAAMADQYGGLFANDEALADKLIAAGEASGERVWRFPLGDAFDKMIESPIADMKNMGGRYGGSITAAQFIKRYIKDGVAWAHLDIAGMVWADKPGPLWDKGATGYGVRLLDRLVTDLCETA